MGKLIRCITSEGAVMVSAVDSTDIVAKAEQIHETSAVVTAALGRMLTAASMMGNMLKGKDNTISLKIDGGGPAGAITVSSDSDGNVRGYAQNNIVEIPLKPNGKLDVSGAVGRDGNLFVTKNLGMKEPYNGFVPITSGEIAEDITYYYATSEQIPTVCALGVLVDTDLSVKKAGGYILQLLPFTENEIIEKIEKNLARVKPVTQLLEEGMDIEDIVRDVLEGFDVEVIYTQEVAYKCKCSREKIEATLAGLGEKELKSMYEDLPQVDVKCHFCNTEYSFSKNDIEKILKKYKKIKNFA